MRYTLLAMLALLSIAALAACGQAADASRSAAVPAAVKALGAQGINVQSSMDAPAGYKGYMATYRGHPIPVYLLPDGKHVVVGTLFDAQGNDLTQSALAAAKPGLGQSAWARLGKATWIAEGPADAKRIVYVFTDTECPFCHKLWQAIQPDLRQGHVQVRYILVAVIKQESLPRAATILDATDPKAAFRRHESDFGHSPIQLEKPVADATRKKLAANTQLMSKMGIQGTPGIVYKDARGRVKMLQGMPPGPRVQAIFGGAGH